MYDRRLGTRFNSRDSRLQQILPPSDVAGSQTKIIRNWMDRRLHTDVQELVRTTNSIEDACAIIEAATRIARASGIASTLRGLSKSARYAETLQRICTSCHGSDGHCKSCPTDGRPCKSCGGIRRTE